ncbi:MAG: penicillin acylase family protein [Pseudomonadota bacterium]
MQPLTTERPARATWLLTLAAGAALTAACSGGASTAPDQAVAGPGYLAQIRRTGFGVPHIRASDEANLGYGVAYAYAEDNLCALADEFVTVNGQRSAYFGPDASRAGQTVPNLQTDYFYRLLNDEASVQASWQQQPAEIQALITGYVAGYNRYLNQAAAQRLPGDCQGAAWLRKIGVRDIIKLMRRYAVEGGAGQFIGAMAGAVPPAPVRSARRAGAGPAAARPLAAVAPDHVLTARYWQQLRERSGSNAVALGRAATDNGRGMLLGNPHFPWKGSLRFYQLHLTIPGKLDVMGAALGGFPVVNIGYNQHLAWSHTVTSSAHFTLFQLQLDPADPTVYLVDGQRKRMRADTISIDVKAADGKLSTQSRTFYSSQFGPLVVVPGVADWSGGAAYALRDANRDNHRLMAQWYAMDRAGGMAQFRQAIDQVLGLPWVNTVAADKDGNTLFSNVNVVPYVSSAKQDSCTPAPFRALAAQGLYVLDASRSACDWDNDPAAPQPGVFGAAALPALTRDDYVQNSNDSAWLSNPASPLRGFPAIVSAQDVKQSGRTRIGIAQLQARLAGGDGLAGNKMSLQQLQQLALSNRLYHASHVMADVLQVCAGDKAARAADGAAVDLTTACARLAEWDGSANLDANMGYLYFTGLWDRIEPQNLWAVPFDPADPVHTPRRLQVALPAVAAAVRQALASSVQAADANGWHSEARWGQIQIALRGQQRIPIHGGPGAYGIYNALTSVPLGDGQRDVVYGTSYIQAVRFDQDGPQAQTMLSYSQSSQAQSPHFADQTWRFSRKAWIVQPFTEAQIAADPAYRSITVSE